MKTRVLYFPYIRVPESQWLAQMLLYWDQVSSIVPYEFTMNPDPLGPYMLNLLREGLVVQVMPGAYIYEIPRFFENFNGYIDGLGQEMDARRERFARGETFQIHIEKMGDIGDALVRHQLAASRQYPWYEVERETANDFMSYLASALGQIPAVDASPVTDEKSYLERFVRVGVPRYALDRQLEALRIQVLDQVLPVPKFAVEPAEIGAFKKRHREKLGDFRRRVERELIDALDISEPALRRRHLELFFDEAQEHTGEIQEEMRSAGWETAKAGLSVIAAVPGVSALVGLAGALWNAISPAPQPVPRDFAYAAYAGSELARAN